MARVALAFFVVAILLAGCIKGPTEDETPAANVSSGNVTPQNATLPDGRGESAGLKETNKTEQGVGGVEHKHDYWRGKESVVIFDQTVELAPLPVFPDGEGSSPRSVAYVKLPNETDGHQNLVYEGAVKVTVLIGDADPALPAPTSFALQYRSAADSQWRDPQPLVPGTALEIPVKPTETDMPHSVSSLWVFRLTTDRLTEETRRLTITVHKGGDVVDWPGHPDFYAASPIRKVADNQHVKTHMSGIAGSFLYDQGGTWATPAKLISWGTTKLLVYINNTKTTAQTGQDATGYFLEAHNATIIGPEITFGTRYFEKDGKNDLKSYAFEVPVDATGMDGPYQPESRWGFRAMATFADVGNIVGLCPGCFDYDIEYDLTVLAIHEDAPPAS